MEIYYPDSCEEVEQDHICDECEASEGARVRSAFFIKEDYVFTNPANTAEWITAIEDGNVIVVPNTNGSFDGGTPNYGPGFGDEEQRYINSTYKATYRDPNLKVNYDFYEGKKRSSRWKFGFRTETLVWIGDKVATFAPKNVVADDAKVAVVWEVEVSWNSRNAPEPFTMPADIFEECFLTSD